MLRIVRDGVGGGAVVWRVNQKPAFGAVGAFGWYFGQNVGYRAAFIRDQKRNVVFFVLVCILGMVSE